MKSNLAHLVEEPLAEVGKTVYIDHWTSPVNSIFLLDIFCKRIIAKCPLFTQEMSSKMKAFTV